VAGVDGFDGLAKLAGQRVGGGDDMGAGLDLNGAVQGSKSNEVAICLSKAQP